MFFRRWINSYSLMFFIIPLLSLSCNSDEAGPIKTEPLYITITGEQHHLGDNDGSEGAVFSGNFEVTSLYEIAILSITFLFPNNAGQSGPEIDSPPEIKINNIKVGLSTSNFPDRPECIPDYREYECDVTIFIGIAEHIKIGKNTVTVISKGAAHDGDDDFVFTDLIIELFNNDI